MTKGSWMIIEDTVLHNGVRNDNFDDPGAHQSVLDFLEGPTACAWESVRNHTEKFTISWNTKGYLRRIDYDDCADQAALDVASRSSFPCPTFEEGRLCSAEIPVVTSARAMAEAREAWRTMVPGREGRLPLGGVSGKRRGKTNACIIYI